MAGGKIPAVTEPEGSIGTCGKTRAWWHPVPTRAALTETQQTSRAAGLALLLRCSTDTHERCHRGQGRLFPHAELHELTRSPEGEAKWPETQRRTIKRPTLAPIAFAIGIAVVLAGLVVSPGVILPVGGAITLLAAFAWIRGSGRQSPTSPEPESNQSAAEAERFPRNRFLERGTLALGGLIAAGVALPAIAVAVLPALGRAKPKAVDLGPIEAFPEGQFVIATFLSDPQAGEVSRRAAFVREQLRREVAELHDHVQPLHTRRLPDATERADLCAAREVRADERRRGEGRPGPTRGRLRLSLPWQRVRHRRQPHGRAGAASARSLSVLDPQRPTGARPDLQRQPRRRRRRDRTDPQLQAPRRREPASGPESLLYPVDPIS